VKLDAAYVKRIADATGFDAVQLEKVIRLRQLLIEFHKHPFLPDRFRSPCTRRVPHLGEFDVFIVSAVL